MMYYILAVVLCTLLVARIASRRGVPGSSCCIENAGPWFDSFGFVFVVLGYILATTRGDEHAARDGMTMALIGGGASLMWLVFGYFLNRPNPDAAQSQTPHLGWEMSFGRAVWTTNYRSSATSVFGWWRQMLGLVHFVDGLEVFHFRPPCDNGGKVEAKIVLVPRWSYLAPRGFTEEVEENRGILSELITDQAKRAKSAREIRLESWFPQNLKLHPDTDIAYTGPPEHYKPVSVDASSGS